MNFIAKDQQEIFKFTARLFPLNFPPINDPADIFADKELVKEQFREELTNL